MELQELEDCENILAVVKIICVDDYKAISVLKK